MYSVCLLVSQSVEKFFNKFNYAAQEEIRMKKLQYDFRGLSKKFEKSATTSYVITSISSGVYTWI